MIKPEIRIYFQIVNIVNLLLSFIPSPNSQNLILLSIHDEIEQISDDYYHDESSRSSCVCPGPGKYRETRVSNCLEGLKVLCLSSST